MKKTVGAIIEKEGKVLLTKRNVEPFRGCWCLPGGHLEPGETSEEAIVREVREETGLYLEPVFFMKDLEEVPRMHWLAEVSFFTGDHYGQLDIDEKEVQEAGWFGKEEISELKLAFNHKKILDRYFEKNG